MSLLSCNLQLNTLSEFIESSCTSSRGQSLLTKLKQETIVINDTARQVTRARYTSNVYSSETDRKASQTVTSGNLPALQC